MPARWADETVVILASGPSLNQRDCDAVRESGKKTIAINSTFFTAPWVPVVFAVDYRWWNKFHAEVPREKERWTCDAQAAKQFQLARFVTLPPFNGGQCAIKFAAEQGAKRILLLGYDAQLTGGKTHHHGDHQGMSNPNHNKCAMWRVQNTRLAQQMHHKNVSVINCSRVTALKCFPLGKLEDYL